jgi:hypothetical protein
MTAIYPGHENYDEVMLAARNEYLLWLNRNNKQATPSEDFEEQLVMDEVEDYDMAEDDVSCIARCLEYVS